MGHACPQPAGASEGGLIIIIDLSGGAIWETVDKAANKHDLATVGGTVNRVCQHRDWCGWPKAGLTLGGGYGYLSSSYGLALDNALEVSFSLAPHVSSCVPRPPLSSLIDRS